MTLLYNRSCFSLMESNLTIEKMVSFASEHGYKALGIADRNVLFAAMKFYHLCKDHGIKPLLGMEVQLQINESRYPVLLFAENDDGYQKMISISTKLNSETDHLEISDFESLNGIICIIPADDSIFVEIAEKGSKEQLMLISSILSPESCIFGVEDERNPYYRSINGRIRAIASELGYKTIALPLACYKDDNDFYGFKVQQAARRQLTYNDQRLSVSSSLYMRTPKQLTDGFSADDLKMTDLLAERMNVTMDFAVNSLPVYENTSGVDSKTYLNALCHLGLKKRLNTETPGRNYLNRLNYELEIICSMNYQDYFLIVYDIYLHAKKKDIYMGVGRGSVCGCLVAYCLGITHVDPIRYGLLFERFLNPERISMPDIDIDIPDNRRSEIIDYVREKYGNEHISHIITFNTFGARNALREACRIHGIVTSKTDILASTVSAGANVTIREQLNSNKKFARAIEAVDDKERNILRTSLALEGLPRNISTHAAGILISRRKLIETLPLLKMNDSVTLSQYTTEYLEEMGLIKFDFLGLKNLYIIDEISKEINKTNDFNILNIPLDDRNTYRILCTNQTAGIFQLESFGMNRLISQVQPNCINDIIDCIALYRPGPMENIPAYLAARKDPDRINYMHQDIREILKPTYGIMIYQEQIMQVSQIIAGFSYGKADLLRRAISKKDSEKMNEMKSQFIEGALHRGYDKTLAEEVYQQISRFANYGFNKSHSVAYSLIAYQQLYLKANFPAYFYSSLINSIAGNVEKSRIYLNEARQRKLRILKPDINLSDEYCLAVNDSIRLSLSCIKTINMSVIEKILMERKENGIFTDYENFVIRACRCHIDEKYIVALIKAGTLDGFGLKRKTMISELKNTMKFAAGVISDGQQGAQIRWELLDVYSHRSLNDGDYTDYQSEKQQDELESYGFYLSAHPVEALLSTHEVNFSSMDKNDYVGRVRCTVMITSIKTHRTKGTGEEMSFISGEDQYGPLDLVMMPDVHQRYFSSLSKGDIIYVEGSIDQRHSVKINRLEILNRKG